jgi:hypothetical protein
MIVLGKIFGTVRDKKTGKGVEGLRVEAWHDDFPRADDLLAFAKTDGEGNYRISYRGGHWDPTVSARTGTWSPDIYVRALIKNDAREWTPLTKSQIHRNHPLTDDLLINLDVEIEEPLAKMTPFDISEYGFHFDNIFTVQADFLGVSLGRWVMGFCGGMCAAAVNRFDRSELAPPGVSAPTQGTTLYRELGERQFKTMMFPNLILDEMFDWQSAPDAPSFLRKESVGLRTRRQWPKLKGRLDNDRPTILVLIRVEGYFANPTRNHQVLAIGYNYHPTTQDLRIQVYDPNHADTLQTLSMNLALPTGHLRARDSTGAELRGFFVNPNGDAASR